METHQTMPVDEQLRTWLTVGAYHPVTLLAETAPSFALCPHLCEGQTALVRRVRSRSWKPPAAGLRSFGRRPPPKPGCSPSPPRGPARPGAAAAAGGPPAAVGLAEADAGISCALLHAGGQGVRPRRGPAPRRTNRRGPRAPRSLHHHVTLRHRGAAGARGGGDCPPAAPVPCHGLPASHAPPRPVTPHDGPGAAPPGGAPIADPGCGRWTPWKARFRLARPRASPTGPQAAP